MTGDVAAAVISACSALAVAVVGGVFGVLHTRRRRRGRSAIPGRFEVVGGAMVDSRGAGRREADSHGADLRDDLDRLALAAWRLERTVGHVFDDLRGLREDIGRLDRRDIEDGAELREVRAELRSRIAAIESEIDAHREGAA